MRLFTGVYVFILLCLRVKSDLFPEGKQWKYSYYGVVRTGTFLPSEAYSQWDLRALLTISAIDGKVIVQLDNLNSSLYNGPRDAVPEYLNPTPVPEEAKVLENPFIINYVGTQIESISVDENEALWAVNIKRAIASVLQLNFEKLNTPASFITENNLYGSCSGIEYSVVNNTEFVYIRKVIDHLKCNDYPAHIWSSAPKFNCPGVSEDPFTASTTREYTLGRQNGNYELEHVMSNRRLYIQPFQAQGEAQHTYEYQMFQLIESSSSPEKITLSSKLKKTSLTYILNIRDLNQGRYVGIIDPDFVGAINTLLDEVVENLDADNLDQNIVQFHRELMFLYYNMFPLRKQGFEKLYKEISIGTSYQQETKKNIFLELLPQVGSEDSVNFMKDLIVKKEIKGLNTVKILAMFPFYVKQHSKKLLNDMEVLMNLNENYDQSIRQAAVLSFATLVYQTFQAGKCDLETLEDYSLKYFNSFAESTSYEKRMLYLQGLDNLQLGSVVNYLSSIVQNNEQSRHIRFLAALASTQSAHQRPIQVYETYWPILTDRSQHLEMRVVALQMLLISQPTKSRLLTLFWYMHAGNDPHLYNYFYTTLISLQKTHYPCYKHLGKLASHVARLLKSPRTKQQWMSGNYILDYSDTDKAFGGFINLFLIGNPVSNNLNVAYITVNNYATEKSLNEMSIYVKLQGVADYVQDVMNNQVIDMKSFDKLIKLLEESNVKLIPPEDIHVELIVKIHRKTVFSQFVDGKGFKKIASEMKNIKMMLEYHVNYQSIVVPYMREYMEPSDLGTLIIRSIVSNSIASTRGNFLTHTDEQKYDYNFDVDSRYYTYTTSFLETYNPISDMWHGAERAKKLQARLQFNGTINIDVAKSMIELGEVRNHKEYINILIHSHTYTYLVSNGTKALQHHCPKCDNIYNITAGLKKDKMYLVDKPFESFGSKFQIIVFDCDSYPEVKNSLFDVYSAHRSNSQILPLAKPILYLMHLQDYVSYIPCQGSCGISINIKPLYKEDTQLKITLLLPQEAEFQTQDPQEKGLKYVSVVTLSQKKLNDQTNLQFWNASLESYWLPVKRYLNYSIIVQHKDSKSEENKLCIESAIQFPDIQADMFSIKPSKETIAEVNAIWGNNVNNPELCPENGSSIRAIASASVTDEQNKLISSSENWPYKECRDTALGHKFTPISLACYLSSKEAATYRKYFAVIKFSNMPEWFISLTQKLQSLIGLIQKHSTQDDQSEKNKEVTNLNIGLEFSASLPEIHVKWNDKQASLNYEGFEFVDKLLLNSRFLIKDDLNINLGLNKVCLITPKYITTVDNRTIPLEEIKLMNKNTLATADCSKFPKFAIFLDNLSNFEQMSFTIHAGNDILKVTPIDQNITITLNEKPLPKSPDLQHNINVWRLDEDVILTKTRFNSIGVDIYYTKEYMVLTIPGIYSGKTCGLCSSIESTRH